jgi:predicted metal-binding protein
MEKYVHLAKELHMINAKIISPKELFFDIRAILKCRWGCEYFDARELSAAVLEIERNAFLDGYYLAFAIRTCNLCKDCAVKKGDPCPTPEKVRPCDSIFGIDVYKTARNLGLPCEVLQSKTDIQNRYGFVFID